MREKSETGKIGENIACAYLLDKKWKILNRNVKKPWGEIDILARDQEGVLVFVEVKALSSNTRFKPEQHFNSEKIRKTKRVSQMFAADNEKLIQKHGWRIDLIAIEIINPLLTNYKKDCSIRHYENI